MKVRSIRIWAALAVAMAALVSCGGEEAVDKAGGDTIVLRIGTIDGVNNNGQSFGPQAFVDALSEVSEGRLQVEVIESYGEGAADSESDLVAAIASGELDGGWPSTRAFAVAGISGLEAVEAPMTITSYEAQKALVSGPLEAQVIEHLDGSGVVGLGLSVGPLRRPFASAPLLGPEDWMGASFRVYNSPVQADVVRALGGEPVNIGFGWIDEVRAGNLRGAEFDLAQYWTNNATGADFVTSNVVLWPKVFVLSVSEDRFDSLSEEQRAWLVEAANRAGEASVEATYDETSVARDLCDRGVRFVDASPDQLAAMSEMLTPVIDQIAGDPVSGPLLAEIQVLAAEHGGPEALDVPTECRLMPAEADGGGPGTTIPEQVAGIPDGLYRVEISAADVEAAQFSNSQGLSGIWSLEIEQGTYFISCRPLDDPGKDCGNFVFDDEVTFDPIFEAGFVRGSGNTANFVYDAEIHSELTGCELPCFPLPTYSVIWVLEGDALRFSDLKGIEFNEKVIKPYLKIN